MGTEIVFPWWFMAVTSTTLLSSFAPSPRQIYKTASNIYLRCVWPKCVGSFTATMQRILFRKLDSYSKCTYCSEFKEMLQVLLLISLESVERHFRGQFTA